MQVFFYFNFKVEKTLSNLEFDKFLKFVACNSTPNNRILINEYRDAYNSNETRESFYNWRNEEFLNEQNEFFSTMSQILIVYRTVNYEGNFYLLIK
jgi:hypothetical protein